MSQRQHGFGDTFQITRLPGLIIGTYTTLTNLNTKYLEMRKVYTDVGGIK